MMRGHPTLKTECNDIVGMYGVHQSAKLLLGQIVMTLWVCMFEKLYLLKLMLHMGYFCRPYSSYFFLSDSDSLLGGVFAIALSIKGTVRTETTIPGHVFHESL